MAFLSSSSPAGLLQGIHYYALVFPPTYPIGLSLLIWEKDEGKKPQYEEEEEEESYKVNIRNCGED